MTASHDSVDILILGAGLTGLVAARQLHQAGYRVRLLDKGFHPGGRMASRSIGTGAADHGAQVLTLRDPEMQAWCRPWITNGQLIEWWPNHYRPQGSFRAWSLGLADGLTVHTQITVSQLTANSNGWNVTTREQGTFSASSVVLTFPLPQALQLLDQSGIALPESQAEFRTIAYSPCFVLVAELAGPSNIAAPGKLESVSPAIAWIADHHQKGISPESVSVAIQATADWSRANYDVPEADNIAALLADAAPYLGSPITATSLKRWRYAFPTSQANAPVVTVCESPRLILAGDAFGGPNLEGAIRSGLAAATLLQS
ncbi:NAD(P)/FAD-dependent oxidoreductase [Tuwongella immobilis]|uniref:Amine oxidase domain-containing protein n=1 Tax=Tuwongella immobilis TaxID=692036 RepID=A0A6C2YKZ7_9BACT|nr:FAD-dependent oxidoreductase [Tuwongella immobilis]VIP01592.1 nad fad-dependent oxidoreductase : Amine oxidase OS=Fischerella sp. JSC-11 GN=FJSC11DRAFT_1621 PE=4 SV=1: NAD_binding_8: Amino_oxidase [Tuwongella immobilis]VTR98865.1 nad fad-dependent oxidoreductase : Amine oxidase OS=Fischerella sp. JSC-11 GN=FJSC11DRAFT_1621 PE=4 SV=1: NAD_binding_8: Amino_oxidase [Tuwongella immobilis]